MLIIAYMGFKKYPPPPPHYKGSFIAKSFPYWMVQVNLLWLPKNSTLINGNRELCSMPKYMR